MAPPTTPAKKTFKATIVRDGSSGFIRVGFDPVQVFGRVRQEARDARATHRKAARAAASAQLRRRAGVEGVGILLASYRGMKSLPLPVAHVRNNLSDVLKDVRAGTRVRVTRHGKPVGWIIGADDREKLSTPPIPAKKSRSRRQRRPA